MKLPKSSGKLKKVNLKSPLLLRRIQGHSMMPVLPPGTLVWVWVLSKNFRKGQTVVFRHQGKEKIKRLDDVRPDSVFVVGDHQLASTDSHQFGWIAKDQVIGVVIWPHAPKDRSEHL